MEHVAVELVVVLVGMDGADAAFEVWDVQLKVEHIDAEREVSDIGDAVSVELDVDECVAVDDVFDIVSAVDADVVLIVVV